MNITTIPVDEIRYKKCVDNLSEHNQFCSAIGCSLADTARLLFMIGYHDGHLLLLAVCFMLCCDYVCAFVVRTVWQSISIFVRMSATNAQKMSDVRL